MSYKMSYKVRSVLFFFGFVLAAVGYNSVEEELLLPNGATIEQRQEVNAVDMADLDSDVATSIMDMD